MQLKDAQNGLMWLHFFVEQRDVVLLCGCSDYRHCHRLLVCTLFKQRVPAARIVHLVSHPAITPQWEEHLHREEVQL